jgi:ribosomal protein S18 acetylase RimI-like enzyme
MPIHLRPARPEEAEAIRALVRTAYALYVPRMDREPAPMLADYGALVAQGIVTVACEGDAMLGILVCYPRGDHLHVENVAVVPAAQGRGVGRLLLAEAERLARARGLARVELYTNAVMTENFPFYAALGYEQVGRGREAGYERVFFRKSIAR